MSHFAHPVKEGEAAIFHGAFVLMYFLALGFHAVCACGTTTKTTGGSDDP